MLCLGTRSQQVSGCLRGYQVFLLTSGMFWPAHTCMAAMAGGSEHVAEEERGRGQAAVGQQTRQTPAGQRGDQWGNRQMLGWVEFHLKKWQDCFLLILVLASLRSWLDAKVKLVVCFVLEICRKCQSLGKILCPFWSSVGVEGHSVRERFRQGWNDC